MTRHNTFQIKQKLLGSALSICLVLTTACTVTPYTEPDIAQKLNYTTEVRESYSVDETWWQGYDNPELSALVDKALTNNPDYLKAAINIEKELARLSLTTSDLFPTLSGSLGTSGQKGLNKGHESKTNFSGEFALNYEADLYGKIRDARTAQEFEYQATFLDRQSAKLSLINSTIDLYFNLTYLNNAIKLAERNIKSYQDTLKITEQKYKSGKVDNLEVAQARQSLLSEKNKLLTLTTTFKETEQSLKNIVAAGPDDTLDLKYENLINQKILSVDMNVPLSVLANRPDLMAAQYRLEKAFKNLNAQEKNYYPTVSLQGAISSSSDKARSTFDFPIVFGSVGVDLPFLDYNRIKNNIKISKADYEITLIEFNDTLNQALNETAYYYYAYEKSLEIFKNLEANYKNAVKITKYYQIRYDNGKAEFKDLLEAINKENTMRQELVAQKYQIIKYENYIYKSTAGKYKKIA